jgi:hypothetical protein
MIYKVTTYNLTGKIFYVKEAMPGVVEKRGKFYHADGSLVFLSRLWYFTDMPPENAFEAGIGLLPYFADVTQDIAPYYHVKPKTFLNCQLLEEKRGGYLQFIYPPTKEVLLIAMNSHNYQPTHP